ncbi:Dynein heavy chain family protein [Trichomonas vaginalis G3]|uniref:Dynein heavy chain family protein n=1 Tax=Trichomonas vaginalis (strain ATCC PRA-98 / G3) TaxID=412133 RepID=A2D8C6_TRIV3|nr:dynein heavy chain family protein family [Trichomonas vaginalis G3]EAY23175.1 Dynein heavy chain family protein [Trichomonas vaginalis G3]KAI5534190.1 dynein heavy chain family protein family [Trichomonas vaginalis G3]|eukprot:XP_001584161.1 Dynein heavy chain family protein [Trichomonas vaginalis G3]
MKSLLSPRPLTSLRPKPLNSVEIVQHDIELERESLAFPEDPIAYFSKCKDGTGHRFIYLNYTYKRDDPQFNPYSLSKVPYAEIDPEYFTMSANGVTRIQPDGDTEHVSLDLWAKESSIFLSIRKLQMFSKYYYWKPFKIWRNFVMKQRFETLRTSITQYPMFHNPRFFASTVQILRTTCNTIINKYLLPFIQEKKYNLDSFIDTTESNFKLLHKEYLQFIADIAKEIVAVDKSVRDPQRLVVNESKFPEIKRKNPNIEQLKILEVKINQEKINLTRMVDEEIQNLANFILQTDYILLEYLAKSCMVCWKNAKNNIRADAASIFQIEVSLADNGDIAFSPNLDELISTVRDTLDDSIDIVNKLPRLVLYESLVPFLQERYKKLQNVINSGPTFLTVIRDTKCFQEIKQDILDYLTNVYKDAEQHCQLFKDYFSIAEMGRTWKPENYGYKRGGKSVDFTFKDLSGSIHFDPSKQIIVDFSTVRHDIEQFKRDEQRMNQFPSCIVRGPLFVDSKNLRNLLSPIPSRSLKQAHSYLDKMMQEKIEYLTNIFHYCSKHIKKEPPSLEQYVEFCKFNESVSEMSPYLTQEISFVDNLFSLFETAGFQPSGDIDLSKNPLHDEFRRFKADQGAGAMMKELHEDKFTKILQSRVLACNNKLSDYMDEILQFPQTIDECDTPKSVKQSSQIVLQIENLHNEVVLLAHCQQVLGIKFNNLISYDTVLDMGKFMSKLYKIIDSWKELNLMIQSSPFVSMDIERFCTDLEKLNTEATELSKNATQENPLLIEVINNLNKIVPFIPQLRMLFTGKMEGQHWIELFDECGQPGKYTPEIKIIDLLQLNILSEKEKIEKITSTSKGESALIEEFKKISAHWEEVQLPLRDGQQKADDSLLLGDLNPLFKEIKSSQDELQKMLQIPFVHVVKKELMELGSNLQRYAEILDMWRSFQSNWVILQAFFSLDGTSDILPEQSTTFAMVRRRWMSLVRHTLERTTLVHVAKFPSLLEHLTENNQGLENIIGSISAYIDHKRKKLLRLFFLSDNEVLSLYSTTDFEKFCSHLSKIFMHITGFDSQMQESADGKPQKFTNTQNFTRLKIIGFIGENTEVLSLRQKIMCTLTVEDWVSHLMESMKYSVKYFFTEGYKTYTTMPLTDWTMTITSYISALVLYTTFTREIEECFANVENNAKAFSNYESLLNQRLSDLTNYTHSPLAQSELSKISVIITILQQQIALTREFSERIPQFSQKIAWRQHLKLRYDVQSQKIMTEMDDFTIEHGYEFWGTFRPLIYSSSSQKAVSALVRNSISGYLPYLFGAPQTGKHQLLSSVAALFGQFVFTVPGFTAQTYCDLSQIFIGAAITGHWVVFNDVQHHSLQTLTNLFEKFRYFQSEMQGINTKIVLNDVEWNFNKGCRFFLVGSDEPLKNEKIFPSQLLSILKPVAMMKPQTKDLTEIKLSASGFMSTKYIAQKLVMLIETVTTLYNYVENKYIVSIISSIIDSGTTFLRHIMHSKSILFLHYYESARSCEEFCIARACYTYYKYHLKTDDLNGLIQLLYSHFMLFDGFDNFKQNLTAEKYFQEYQEELAIKYYFANISTTKLSAKVKEYLVEKVIDLHRFLKVYNVVIINGSPYSGKSSLITLLKELYEYENPDFQSKVPTRLPINKTDIYFGSDKWLRISGTKENKWKFGELHSVLYNLQKSETLQIVKFDGPISPEFSDFISSLYYGGTLMLNSFDRYKSDEGMKVIVETNDLSFLKPDAIGRVGILNLNDIHVEQNTQILQAKQCSILYPEIIFDEGSKNSNLQKEVLSNLKDLFVQIAPQVVDYIYHTKNCIYYSESLKMVKDGNVYISHHLPLEVVKLCLSYLETSDCDCHDSNNLKIVMVHSFFIIYKNIIDVEQINLFDTWIRSTYIIEIPPDWVNFSVPDTFWDIYSRPSLLSMRLYKGKLIPLDYSPLQGKPIINSSQGYTLASDVSVCSPQFLPALFHSRIAMRKSDNLIIHGERLCGKSTLLKFMFLNTDIIPIYIPVTKTSTRSSICNFIQFHTKIIAKDYVMEFDRKKYCLIFDNVCPDNKETCEFIRAITKTSKIPDIHQNDFKKFDYNIIKSCQVIVITSSLQGFDVRFLSRFVPILVPPPTYKSIKYIYDTIGKAVGISAKILQPLCDLFEVLYNQNKINFHFSKLIEILSIIDCRNAKTEQNMTTCIKTILAELNFLSIYRQPETVMELLKKSFNDIFFLEQQRQIFDIVFNSGDMYYSEISQSENNQLSVLFNKHQLKGLTNMLTEVCSNLQPPLPFTLRLNSIIIWSHLQRAISYPTGNCLLIAPPGSGRYHLTRFAAFQKSYSFFVLDKAKTPLLKSSGLCSLIDDVLLSILGGHSVVLFVRGYTQNELKLLNINTMFEIFDNSHLEDIYQHFNTHRQNIHATKYDTYNYAFEMIRNKIHFVIAVDKDFDISEYPDYYVIDFYKLNSDYMQRVANNVIKEHEFKPLSETAPTNIGKVLLQIHEEIQSKFEFVTQNIFNDFASTFVTMSRQSFDEINKRSKDLENAINFIKDLTTKSKETEHRLNEITPLIEQLNGNADNNSQYASKMDEKRSILSSLDEKERIKTAECKQLNEMIIINKEQMTVHLSDYTQKLQLLNEIQPSELQEFRQVTSRQNNPVMISTINLLCSLLNQSPNFETNRRKLINDESLPTTLRISIDPNNISEESMNNAEQYFNEVSLNSEQNVTQISPVLGKLFSYAVSVYNLALSNSKVKQQETEYNEKSKDLAQFIESSHSEKKSIEEEMSRIDEEAKSFQSAVEMRDQLEKELATLENKKQAIDTMLKGLDLMNDEWMEEGQKVSTQRLLLIGDTILFSAYIVYFGFMKQEEREENLVHVLEIIRNSKIQVNLEPHGLIESKLKDVVDYIHLTKQEFQPLDSANDLSHIMLTPKPPLIIDPDDMMFNLLKEALPKQKYRIVSMLSESFCEILNESMHKGFTLIIRDVNRISPELRSVLPYLTRRKDMIQISLNGELSKLSPNFKAILFTSEITEVKQIPTDLFCHTTVVDVSDSTLKSSETMFGWRLVNYFDTELVPRMLSMTHAELQNKSEVKKFEEETLHAIDEIVERTMKEEDFDFLSDGKVSSDLMRSKECYFAATNFTSDTSAINNEVDMTTESFRTHIKVLSSLWTALSRYMPRVCKTHFYSLQTFLKSIELGLQSSGFTSGILTQPQLQTLKTSLIRFIFKTYLPTMTVSDSFFYMFISGYLISEKEHKVQMKDLDIIIDHIVDENFNKVDLRKFETQKGDPIDQLKFSNITNIFRFIDKFICDVFGDDYSSLFPSFSVESFTEDKNIILQCEHFSDPTVLLENFVTLRGKKSFFSVSLNENSLEQSKKICDIAMEKGGLIAIHYMNSSPNCGTFISSLSDKFNEQKNFHIILICSDSSYIPRDFVLQSSVYSYDDFPLIKVQMNQLYQHVVSSIELPTKLSKKITYGTCLAYSLIKFSNFLSPIGISSKLFMTEDDIKGSLLAMHATQNDEIFVRNYREYIKDSFLSSSCVDENDHRKLKQILFTVLGPDLPEESFSFVDSSNPNKDKWILSSDPIHNIDKLPDFGTLDPLLIDNNIGQTLLWLNFSKWCSKPFFSFYKGNPDLEEKDYLKRLEILRKDIPSIISLNDIRSVSSPLTMFVITEIERYNDVIREIDLDTNPLHFDIETAQAICQGKCPHKWKETLGYYGTDSLHKMTAILNERNKLLSEWFNTGIIPKQIDSRLITNIRGLLNSYRNEISIQRNSTTNSLNYEFKFIDHKDNNPGITFSNFALVGANFDSANSKIIPPNSKSSPICLLPPVTCTLVREAKSVHTFNCPCYMQFPSQDTININGNNFVWSALIQSDVPDKTLISSGTCIVCQPHDLMI